MPHKDPTTGVSVMTTHEFFQEEAKREGKGRSGLDLMSDFADQFERDRLERENELKKPEAALAAILDIVRDWNKLDPEIQAPEPEEIVEVLAVECRDTVRQSGHMIKARCKRSGGVVDVITVECWNSYGHREEPPDWDANVTWDLIDGAAKP